MLLPSASAVGEHDFGRFRPIEFEVIRLRHNCMWFNSASLEVWFTAGTMRYVSSANLQSEFSGVIAARFSGINDI